MKSNKNIAIIGGGPAGLAVGYFAKKYGCKVAVYESSNAIGGNCRTITVGEFRYDTGAHRLHDKNERVTSLIKSMLGNSLLKVRKPSKISFNRVMIDFPLNLSNIISNLNLIVLLKILFENLFKWVGPNTKPVSFKELAYQKYGKTLSELFLISYTEKLWGASASHLSPSIAGGRLRKLTIGSLLGSWFLGKRYKPRHLEGDFYYPVLGFGEIFNAIGKEIEQKNIFLNMPIVKINHNHKTIESIESLDGQRIELNDLVSTMPIHVLAKAMVPPPPDYILDEIEMLEYRSIMICVLFLDIERFSENASIYFPNKSCPFTRIYEPKNRSEKMAPHEKTCIVVETPVGTDKVNIETNKENVYEMVVEYLTNKKLLKKESIIKYNIVDIKYAYPIIYKDTGIKISKISSYFQEFENLHLIGRNADFEYLHTHHIIDKSEKLVNKMVS